MKRVFSCLAIFLVLEINGQNSVGYGYDANGNRDSRFFVGLRIGMPHHAQDSIQAMRELLETVLKEGISVYPNPTRDAINISINKPGTDAINLERANFYLMDISGRIIEKKPCQGQETQVDMSHYAPGNYFLKIEFDRKTTINYQIIKAN